MDLRSELDALANGDDEGASENLETNQVEETNETEQQEDPVIETDQSIDDDSATTEFESTTDDSEEEWTPSFKYKSLGEEFDFPEWSKELVKSKELEESFRSILEKSQGLDLVKGKKEALETEYAEYKNTADSQLGEARQLAEVVQDFNTQISSDSPKEQLSALIGAGLTEKAVLDIARHVLDLQKLAPEQRQAYDAQFEQRNQITEYERTVETQNAQLQQIQVQAAQAELNSFLSSRADIVKEYESREGNKAGDFQENFIHYGIAMQQKLGKDIDYADAFTSFKKVHALGQKQPKPANRQVPNLKSTGHSPIEKRFESMEDLQAFQNKLEGY